MFFDVIFNASVEWVFWIDRFSGAIVGSKWALARISTPSYNKAVKSQRG
jgi:hypothetical protein